MEVQGFYRTWKARVHAIPRLMRFQQPGIGSSYPVFVDTDAGLLVRHFYHTADRIGANTVVLGPARVLASLEYATFEIADVNFEPFSLPLFEDVEYTLSAEERATRRPDIERLEQFYDRLLETYPEAPRSELVDEFAATLQRVVPPVLWPYYGMLLADEVSAAR